MDEECLRPGEPTDKSFLVKMNENLSNHNHYISHKKAAKDLQKSMTREVRSKIHFHCCIFLLGWYPGIWILCANVLEHSVPSSSVVWRRNFQNVGT